MKDFTLVLCWLGVIQSTLLGVFFLGRSRQSVSTLLLGLILLMTAIRVAKSTLYLFDENQPLIILNAGFAAHAFLGPLFLFYVLSINHKFQWTRWLSIQLTPPVFILLLSPYLGLDNFWHVGGYGILLYYTTIYIGAGWWIYFRSSGASFTFKPVMLLLVAISLFQLSYFSNYILRLTSYSTGPMMHGILIFFISFLVLKDNRIFNLDKKKKYRNLNFTESELEAYSLRIRSVMVTQKPYLKNDFSLSALSELTGIPGYTLSYVFSESIKLNFLHFVNSYRVDEAKLMLLDASKNHLSIAGIAYDCGFNTLSSFNAAFKKIAQTTPSEFKRKQDAARLAV